MARRLKDRIVTAAAPGVSSRSRRRRALAVASLAVAVALAHGCTAGWAARHWQDLADDAAMPPRMTMVRVRQLASSTPVVPAAAVPAAPVPRSATQRAAPPGAPRTADDAAPAASDATAVAAASAASAASAVDDAAASAATATAEVAASASAADPVAAGTDAASAPSSPSFAASIPSAQAVGVAADAASSAGMPSATPPADGFAWPESTRLSYRLGGNYRGEVRGTAQVEWLLRGTAYQMHMDIVIGVPFAPLLDRHLASAGRVGPDGLVPERFDEDSRRAFHDRWRLTMLFAPDGIRVGGQRRYDRIPGVQDTLSQFGQLSWRFARHPELLAPGNLVEVPLALPRHLDVWRYRVLAPETLQTPFGAVPTAHLAPTLPPGNGDLSAEIWFAPALRYLPVRIRIAQDASTYVDLLVDRRPEIGDAVPGR